MGKLTADMDEIILANEDTPIHLIVTSIYVSARQGIKYFATTGATKFVLASSSGPIVEAQACWSSSDGVPRK
ncbi:hypothetical protein LINPERPRIM_LOCUS2413 [Linum perenne]